MAYVYATTRTWIYLITALVAVIYAIYFTWINPLKKELNQTTQMPPSVHVKIIQESK